MTKLLFIRHGKTKWNLEGRYQGSQGDSPLLPASYEEIHQLAAALQDIHFSHIYASPLKRARDTAMTLKHDLDQPDLSVTILSRLREFNLGKMEGMAFTDVQAKYPAEFDNFRNHPDLYDPTAIQGESFQQLIKRMLPAIKQIVTANPRREDNVLIVSHGAALNALVNTMLGASLATLRDRGGLSNTSTTILETRDRGKSYKLLLWNDTSYLSRQPDPTDTI
ncbi:histidine phosphatase family protein [Lactiplantibacillus sp. WILCCON 0030]|uniref:Histidine phosphatase family protein n=1 Tax=Lactiplantibacillus brownii TaxID=3069269 RepID=A0ABU1A9J3_9LACO|nr:histidine phosphatase family protein [Lactiplantibacillus brownii]MDQ7937604.1 histidine phosphatase family protein [Lactiplantibacillus brownii]